METAEKVQEKLRCLTKHVSVQHDLAHIRRWVQFQHSLDVAVADVLEAMCNDHGLDCESTFCAHVSGRQKIVGSNVAFSDWQHTSAGIADNAVAAQTVLCYLIS